MITNILRELPRRLLPRYGFPARERRAGYLV